MLDLYVISYDVFKSTSEFNFEVRILFSSNLIFYVWADLFQIDEILLFHDWFIFRSLASHGATNAKITRLYRVDFLVIKIKGKHPVRFPTQN